MRPQKASFAHELRIIPATVEHSDRISNFLNQNIQLHRHLDWYGPLDWLGQQPFLLEINHDDLQAILCATSENEQTAWIRTFAFLKNQTGSGAWQRLLSRSIIILKERRVNRLAALAYHDWFRLLLEKSDFSNRQDIVALEWDKERPQVERKTPEVEIRTMKVHHLPKIAVIDRLAFPSLWQNAEEQLTRAVEQPGFKTIAIKNRQIVGYQISTSMSFYTHLARLAVHPDHQGQNIAFHLVYNLIMQIKKQGYWRLTVNTQSDNLPSLSLYQKLGFTRTGEEIPVYEFEF